MTTLFINIRELLQIRESSVTRVSGKDMNELPSIRNAYLLVEDGLIKDFGEMKNLPKINNINIVDINNKMVLPTWCDSHTHLVFAETREDEFVDRIHGKTYEEIANNGGGILNSARKLQLKSEDELFHDARERLLNLIKMGTGAIEIKSGYGLTTESELKMLRVIKRLKSHFTIPIKATFLGAHAIPEKFKDNKEDYISLIINEMLPVIEKEKLADFIDVFCEKDYFNLHETDRILKAGIEHGLIPKVHVNQFNSIGGIEISVKNKALSVDHLEVLSNKDLEILKNSETIPVALPSCSFFLGIPYTNGKLLMDNNLSLTLASDYNPGSTPSGNMNFVVSLACIKMKMTPNEAINAATLNGANAMNLSMKTGSISIGKLANFIVTTKETTRNFIPYNFGTPSIDQVYIEGKLIE